jgi:hypothetical protein
VDAREAIVSQGEDGRVNLRAIRIDEPIQLDGRFDEAIYQRVHPADAFIQQEPVEGAPATERTERGSSTTTRTSTSRCAAGTASPGVRSPTTSGATGRRSIRARTSRS